MYGLIMVFTAVMNGLYRFVHALFQLVWTGLVLLFRTVTPF